MLKTLVFTILSTLLYSSLAYGATCGDNGDGSGVRCEHSVEVEISEISGPEGQENLKRILKEAHEAIDGHDHEADSHDASQPAGWLSRSRQAIAHNSSEAIQKLDFQNTIFNAIRWANQNKQNPKWRDHILNLAFLYPFSHITELVWAPAYILLNPGMSAEQQAAVFAAGMTSAAFDFICWSLYFVYPIPGVSGVVTKVRLTVVKVSKVLPGASRDFGLKSKWPNLQSKLEFTRATNENEWTATIGDLDSPDAQLSVSVAEAKNAYGEDTIYFSSLKVGSNFAVRSLTREQRSLLGPNLMQYLRKSLKDLKRSGAVSSTFFIDESTTHASDHEHGVRFKPMSFPIGKSWSCDRLFGKPSA